MDLNEYLWRNNKTSIKLSREVNCSHNTIGKIKLHQGSPNLFLALKIYEFCDQEVSLKEMLSKKDIELFEKWILENNKK